MRTTMKIETGEEIEIRANRDRVQLTIKNLSKKDRTYYLVMT